MRIEDTIYDGSPHCFFSPNWHPRYQCMAQVWHEGWNEIPGYRRCRRGTAGPSYPYCTNHGGPSKPIAPLLPSQWWLPYWLRRILASADQVEPLFGGKRAIVWSYEGVAELFFYIFAYDGLRNDGSLISGPYKSEHRYYRRDRYK